MNAVYCLCTNEPQANAVLTHLRNAGFGSAEISVVLKDSTETRNISLKENAVRGAGIGSIAGALLALTIPGLGAVLAVGPVIAALGGAAAGGVVGGLAGGSGGVETSVIDPEVRARFERRLEDGDILIAVHSSDPEELNTAAQIFRSEGVEFDGQQHAA